MVSRNRTATSSRPLQQSSVNPVQSFLSSPLHDLGQVATGAISRSTDQSLTSGTSTKVLFDTIDWESGVIADLTNDRLTVKESGIYIISGMVKFEPNSTGDRELLLAINNGAGSTATLCAQSSQSVAVGFGSHFLTVTTQMVMSPSGAAPNYTYVEMYARQTSGIALNIEVSTVQSRPRLMITKLADFSQIGNLVV